MNYYTFLLIALSFLLVSCFYSMAGFGGGSSYLSILSLVCYDFEVIRSNALLCNVVVVGVGCWIAIREEKFGLREVIPYALLSVPAAFLGAQVPLSERAFFIILGVSLIFSALVLFLQNEGAEKVRIPKAVPLASFAGGVIGWLSGMVGIGGGIFLSPILNLLRWEGAHQVARISGFFILVNSISGIAGLALSDSFKPSLQISLPLLVSVVLGGYAGATISIKKFNAGRVRKITGILVLVVGVRLLLIHAFLL